MMDSKKADILIRKPNEFEWVEIGNLMVFSFFDEYRNLFRLNPIDIPKYFEEIFKSNQTIVAIIDDKIVGCCMFGGSKEKKNPFRTLITIFKTVPLSSALHCLISVFNPSYFPENSVHIDHICVSQDARGAGIGKLLMEHVKAFAKDNGHHSLSLQVNSLNDVAVTLYKSMGFKVEKEVSSWSIRRTLGYESVYFMKLVF